jgi:Ni/Co efflux regulator RcnB
MDNILRVFAIAALLAAPATAQAQQRPEGWRDGQHRGQIDREGRSQRGGYREDGRAIERGRDFQRDRGERHDGDRRGWQDGNRRNWQRDGDWGWSRYDGRDHDRRDWNRNWRDDRRYDWRGHRAEYRDIYRGSRYYGPRGTRYHRWYNGYRAAPYFYAQRHWISDPWRYRLPPAYGGYRWVRYYDDVALVDIRTGLVADVIFSFFL